MLLPGPMYATLRVLKIKTRSGNTAFDQLQYTWVWPGIENSSSVTFINTNVMRNGSTYDANLTAGMFSFNDKTNTYTLTGKAATSRQYNFDGKLNAGYHYNVAVGKTSGNSPSCSMSICGMINTIRNDLGILSNNNEIDHGLDKSCCHLQAKLLVQQKQYRHWNVVSLKVFTPAFRVIICTCGIIPIQKLWSLNVNIDINPVQVNDFYELRIRTGLPWIALIEE